MSGHSFFEHLFEHSQHVTPYLHGAIKPRPERCAEHGFIHIEHASSDHIRALYESLKLAHPEAGAAYWLTRTWTLLCWQPLYVAFIAIYSCQGLPKLSSMGQHVQPRFVSGYQFDDDEYRQGSEQELIAHAGKELCALFDYFRQEMSLWTRIRPGFTQHLFADGVFGCLVKLSQFYPALSGDYFLEQAQLWLAACQLPEKLIHSLRYDETSRQLSLVRTSCCLVYKCQGRELCRDCPRHPDNKRE
ncbi:TPA: siderophore ferric iron reductase [Vibrio vulnificus]|uniref:siderophore ferric iron reductase n=1 Tax=Vibrio vulnificus TaxID=672 RepID=UPI001A203B6B|nr:siderophore ferric iron reductase [Vibrio vulnificus]MCA0768532.1 siderophore ferric iron reductase [Vibrio vulnificus]HAS6061387.1 siderophore ferric iron reductase [Vibrio vulnificus]HAS6196058.1 siderophore ferric iron reductase [Vibrio vulnificus]HAS6241223.1 siderophore ferric iron reductase [Vibrio vulnificus]HDY7944741.1 siderophore ferric iron reductase [Vibrio vulnificus]